ncbi:uncharacterized protein BDW70DRAFT_164476 [Aspergillus foveolatus]|uniref:uncharacterized protein n=1 Tax=Aspergillus foveolatus TaxID=210207 RepID=UPI003CCDCD2E
MAISHHWANADAGRLFRATFPDMFWSFSNLKNIHLVCYRAIELFILKDPDSKCDVLCAIIEYNNIKGRPEGADGYANM